MKKFAKYTFMMLAIFFASGNFANSTSSRVPTTFYQPDRLQALLHKMDMLPSCSIVCNPPFPNDPILCHISEVRDWCQTRCKAKTNLKACESFGKDAMPFAQVQENVSLFFCKTACNRVVCGNKLFGKSFAGLCDTLCSDKSQIEHCLKAADMYRTPPYDPRPIYDHDVAPESFPPRGPVPDLLKKQGPWVGPESSPTPVSPSSQGGEMAPNPPEIKEPSYIPRRFRQ